MTPVRSFYEWADAEGHLTSDLVSRMTEVKYFAAGTGAGGEHGTWRRVLVEELKPSGQPIVPDPEWIEDPLARVALENLTLNARDRFLIDLMYYTGIRAGEALSLFAADMHLGGGSAALGCRYADPHFHVKTDNPVENKARAKGRPRLLYVSEHLVDRYVDYMMERERALRNKDISPHVFVNLYSTQQHNGKAMKYSKVQTLAERCGRRIGYMLTGPHMLRHTFATRLVRGIDCEAQSLDVVQDLLGHRSIESTRIYTHDLEPAKKKALAAIATRTVALGVTA
jgi:site-specific recombinase XerD